MTQNTPSPETGKQKDSGQTVVGVRFQPVGKVYDFSAANYPDLHEGDFVIVTTSRGQQLGQVAAVRTVDSARSKERLKPVNRPATGRDLAIRKHWEGKEQEALDTACKLNEQVGLVIKLIKAEYSFDGKHLTFLYSSEDRKDTKSLRQRLSRAFRARVELHQIGPRDVAKTMGGYGACGGPRCCSTFLTRFNPISIRMAKAQGVSLSPSEITGMCGRLRCCLIYEYEQYVQARKNLPKQGKRVGTPYGEGKVVSLFPLKDTALIDLGERRLEVQREEIMPLEEWRALQERAATPPCDEHKTDAPDRQKPARPPRRDQKTRPKPAQQTRRDKPGSRRPAARRATRPEQKDADPQKPAQTDKRQSSQPKSKPSRRRRRRRR